MGTLWWLVVCAATRADAASSAVCIEVENTTEINMIMIRGLMNRIMDQETTALLMEVRNKNKNQSIGESILNP